MKYLNGYKLFENYDIIDIKDTFIDIIYKDFDINVDKTPSITATEYNDFAPAIIRIEISKWHYLFYYSDVEETLLFAISYIESELNFKFKEANVSLALGVRNKFKTLKYFKRAMRLNMLEVSSIVLIFENIS